MPENIQNQNTDSHTANHNAQNDTQNIDQNNAQNIAVIGAGSWGTALAMQLARNGHTVNLWGRQIDDVQARENQRYLPGITFPETLHYTDDMAAALQSADWVLLAVPSHGFADNIDAILSCCAQHNIEISQYAGIAWATKGLQQGKLLHHVLVEKISPDYPFAIMSGPTFATELAKNLPTALTVAGNQPVFIQTVTEALHGGHFRAYSSTDYIGVQIAGAVKNVLAIAAGASDGLGFGANARTALITRGLAEMTRLGIPLGAEQETFMGLAGLGDLVLTCTDNQSRNRRFGLALASGQSAAEAKAEIGQAVEGEKTTNEVYSLAQSLDIEMPITEQVWQVLNQQKPLRAAVDELINRPNKAESY